jgi:hypothetical protein
LLVDRFDQGHAFALPVTGPNDDNLGRSPGHFNLESGWIVWREQRAARDRKRRQRKTERELGFDSTAKPGCWRRNAFSSAVTASTPVAPVMRLPSSVRTPSFGQSASSDLVTAPGCLR